MQNISDNYHKKYIKHLKKEKKIYIFLVRIENVDNFTAQAACDAIVDLTDWLYLSHEKDALLDDYKNVTEPECLKVDAWAENAVRKDDRNLGNNYMGQEGGKVCSMQEQLSLYGVQNHFENLPAWMKPGTKLEENKPKTPIHEQLRLKLKKNAKTFARETCFSKLKNIEFVKNFHDAKKKTYTLKKDRKAKHDTSKESIQNSIKSCPEVPEPKPVKASPARLRQFRRRKEQQQASTLKKMSVDNKLPPVTPQSARQPMENNQK